MTNNFSFARLWMLIRKQAVENIRLYLLSAAALLLILSLVFILVRYTSYPYYHETTIYINYIFGLIIAGAIFASFSFQQLSSKDKAIYYLSFPASTFEKFLSVLFFNLIVFPIVFTIIFYLVKVVYWTHIQNMAGDTIPGLGVEVRVDYINWKKPQGIIQAFPYFFYSFFAVQAFYIMGSAYFHRFGFIKTTIVGLMLCFLFIWYFNSLIRGGFAGMDGPFSMHTSDASGGRRVFELSERTQQFILYTARLIWAPVFWVVTYFRLKETEV